MNEWQTYTDRQFVRVLNRFPEIEPVGFARIAIVAQSPGKQEAWFGAPLVGPAGELIRDALGQVGIPWNQLFLGNVCQIHPHNDDFASFDWDGPEIQSGIAQLRADLEKFNPTMVLCLGNEALHLFKVGNVAPAKKGREFDWPNKIGSWRGTLFTSEFLSKAPDATQGEPAGGPLTRYETKVPLLKCMATYHPAAVCREMELQGYYRTGLPGVGDLERLRIESGTRELEVPGREILIRTDLEAVLEVLACYRQDRQIVAMDIEGRPLNVTCIAFASCVEVADVIPFAHADGTSFWTEDDEIVIWQAIKDLLEDPAVPKCAQHGQFDFFALAWTYGIGVRNWAHDTEEGMWELFAELKKGLATQASLLTKQPFYKPDREDGELKFKSDEDFWTYNGIDAAVTMECHLRQIELMLPCQRAHYTFNMQVKPITLRETLRGIKVDGERVKEEQEKARRGAMELQARIDQVVSPHFGEDLPRLYDICLNPLGLDEEAFATLVMAQLCGKNPRRREERVEERWQPMRWNGKKWVKAGKLSATASFQGVDICIADSIPRPPSEPNCLWLKPVPRTVSKLVPFTPCRLFELEDHILDSNQSAWKTVKRIWKELTYEQSRNRKRTVQVRSGSSEERLVVGDPSTSMDAGSDGREAGLEGASQHDHASEDAGQRGDGTDREDASEQAVQATGEGIEHEENESGTDLGPVEGGDVVQTDASRIRSAWLGELSTALGLAINASSTSEGGDAQRFLFEVCGLPKIWKDEKTGRLSTESEADRKRRCSLAQRSSRPDQANNKDSSKEPEALQQDAKAPKKVTGKKLCTDQNALDKLYAETEDERALWVLQQRRLKKVVTDLDKEIDDDGRIRCSFSLVKETGRMAASESPTGTGTNLQAWNKDLRRVCVAG